MSITLPAVVTDILPVLQALPQADKLKLIHALSDSTELSKKQVTKTHHHTPNDQAENLAWQVGKDLFGSYHSGRNDTSQHAKILAKQRIRQKYGKNTT